MATNPLSPGNERVSGKVEIVDNVVKFVNLYYKGIEVGYVDEASDWIRDYYKRLLPEKLKQVVDSFDVKLYALVKRSVELPFLFDIILDSGSIQKLYTLFILEPRASLNVSCHCSGAPMSSSSHIRISEIFVAEEASYISDSLTTWKREIDVEDHYYYSVKSHAYVRVSQRNIFSARKKFVEENFAVRGSHSRIELVANNLLLRGSFDFRERLEIFGSKNSVSVKTKLFAKRGEIDNYITILAHGSKNKAYSSCDEFVVGKTAKLRTVPELYSEHPSNELMHEARLGRIKRKEIEYLMARGLSPREILYALLMS